MTLRFCIGVVTYLSDITRVTERYERFSFPKSWPKKNWILARLERRFKWSLSALHISHYVPSNVYEPLESFEYARWLVRVTLKVEVMKAWALMIRRQHIWQLVCISWAWIVPKIAYCDWVLFNLLNVEPDIQKRSCRFETDSWNRIRWNTLFVSQISIREDFE